MDLDVANTDRQNTTIYTYDCASYEVVSHYGNMPFIDILISLSDSIIDIGTDKASSMQS